MQTPFVHIDWQGPFAWPKVESPLPRIPSLPGVYLLTTEYRNGFLVHSAGITRRPIPTRLREHYRNFTKGMYTVLDMESVRDGIRNEIWHGFWTKPRSPEKLADYEARLTSINIALQRQLAAYRIFVA